jgi:hypothetical protein
MKTQESIKSAREQSIYDEAYKQGARDTVVSSLYILLIGFMIISFL